MDKPNIAELAVAAWRLERWLENLNAERKLAAKKSLREIKTYLEVSGIEIVDPLGWKFDEGLPLQIVNNEADDEDDVIIVQTTAPIIKENGAVIQAGKVILGKSIKEQKSNSEIKKEPQSAPPAVERVQEDSQSSNEATLAQSRLIVERDSYWIRIFDLKASKSGCRAAIEVAANFDARLCLMDEQVYFDYFNRGIDRTWFPYETKAGLSYVVPPYQDIWYVIAYPPKGQLCHELSFDMNCIWLEAKTEEGSAPNYAQLSSTTASATLTTTENDDIGVAFAGDISHEGVDANADVATVEEDEKADESLPKVDDDRRKKIKFFGKF